MFGFVVRMDRADYENFYRSGDGWGGKAQPDSMYGLCFRYCLSFVLQQVLIEEKRRDLVLDFIVEEGHENDGAPAEIVKQLKQKIISGVSEFLGMATTGEKKKVSGLQAADGLAFGAWHVEAAGTAPPIYVPSDAPISSLRSQTIMKAPIFRCHADEQELKEFREGTFAHVQYRREYGQRRSRPISDVPGSSGEPQPA